MVRSALSKNQEDGSLVPFPPGDGSVSFAPGRARLASAPQWDVKEKTNIGATAGAGPGMAGWCQSARWYIAIITLPMSEHDIVGQAVLGLLSMPSLPSPCQVLCQVVPDRKTQCHAEPCCQPLLTTESVTKIHALMPNFATTVNVYIIVRVTPDYARSCWIHIVPALSRLVPVALLPFQLSHASPK